MYIAFTPTDVTKATEYILELRSVISYTLYTYMYIVSWMIDGFDWLHVQETRAYEKHSLPALNEWCWSEKRSRFCTLFEYVFNNCQCSRYVLCINYEKIRPLQYRPKSCGLSAFLHIPFVYLSFRTRQLSYRIDSRFGSHYSGLPLS